MASPNPATDKLSLFISGSSKPVNLELVNGQGQVIKKWKNIQTYNGGYDLNVFDLARGVYSLIIELDGTRMIEKVVIQ